MSRAKKIFQRRHPFPTTFFIIPLTNSPTTEILTNTARTQAIRSPEKICLTISMIPISSHMEETLPCSAPESETDSSHAKITAPSVSVAASFFRVLSIIPIMAYIRNTTPVITATLI